MSAAGERPDVTTRCGQCHGPCVAYGSAANLSDPTIPLMAHRVDEVTGEVPATDDAARVCDRCVALRARWELTDGRPAVGYLNRDLTALISWGGSEIARIVRRSTYRSNLTGTTVTAWRGVLPNGRECYGRGAGASMSTTARPCKVRA